jgi:hypothetical protein
MQLTKREEEEMYELLSSLGIKGRNVQAERFAVNGDFIMATTGAGGVSFYFDPMNLPGGDIPSLGALALEGTEAMLIGNLYMKQYCSAFTAGADISMSVSTGPRDNLTWYLVDNRTVAAADNPRGTTREFMYQDMAFNYFNMVIGGGTLTYRCEFWFTGLKLTY